MSAILAQAELTKALLVKWRETSSLDTIRLHTEPAIDVVHPYAVMVSQPTDNLQWTCARRYYRTSVQFKVYHRTPDLVVSAAALVSALLDDENLTLTFDTGGFYRHRGITGLLSNEESGSVDSLNGTWEFDHWMPR